MFRASINEAMVVDEERRRRLRGPDSADFLDQIHGPANERKRTGSPRPSEASSAVLSMLKNPLQRSKVVGEKVGSQITEVTLS